MSLLPDLRFWCDMIEINTAKARGNSDTDAHKHARGMRLTHDRMYVHVSSRMVQERCFDRLVRGMHCGCVGHADESCDACCRLLLLLHTVLLRSHAAK